MRYNRLTDLGIDVSMIQDNLMFATDKIGEHDDRRDDGQADAKAWFGAPPPDLTVEARVRGADWLYNYFLGFYRDDARRERLEQPRVPERRHAARAVDARAASTGWCRPSTRTTRRRWRAAIAVKGLVLLAPAKEQQVRRRDARARTRPAR